MAKTLQIGGFPWREKLNIQKCWNMFFGLSTSPDDDGEREDMNTHLMMKMSVLR
jgi:hypothetical protein